MSVFIQAEHRHITRPYFIIDVFEGKQKEGVLKVKIKFLNGLETRGEVLLSRGDDDTSSAGTTRASRNELIVPSYLFYQPD